MATPATDLAHDSRNPAGYWISRHAAEQMRDRGIRIAEVRAMLADPDLSYPSHPTCPRAEFRRTIQGGRLGVVVDDGSGVIVTVLFRDDEAWAARGELTAPVGEQLRAARCMTGATQAS